MFKKRLQKLLAMLLAGSIAASAMPLTASAKISNSLVTVYDGDNTNKVNYSVLQNDERVSPYLTPDNLWGVYYDYSYYDSGFTPAKEISATGTEAFSGDMLAEKFEEFEDTNINDYSNIRITPKHKYIVTTKDPSTAELSAKSAPTASTFPVEISLTDYDFANPLMDYSCTPWYSTTDVYGDIYSRYAVMSTDEPIRFSAGDESISIGMDTFKGLYSADIDTGNQNDAIEIFLNGITILQLKSEYKTLSLPVKNALLRQEKDSSGDDRHISVSKDSESLLDEGDYYFYLCYYDEEQQSFKISDSAKKYEKDVWDVINAWVNEDPNLDTNKLFLCRKVTVNVNNGNGVDSEFNTKDLLDYLIVNQEKYTTNQALLALFTAKPNSIWEVNPRFTENPSFYTYQKDAATSISDFLLEYPHEKRLNLFEQSSIRVTALDPKTNGEIEWGSFIESKFLDENGEPRKISDYFNDLFRAVPQEAGKKYDTDGWQLWKGVVSCGGLYDFSKVELDKKPDSIGVTELNKMQNSIAFVYFPQVEIAPSLEVTAPVAGETPSTECKILDKLGGYSVDGVEWDCDYNLLGKNDKFEAGKKYRVKIDLLPDGNLSFVDSTPVTINGKEAFETILDDAYFSVYQVFTTAPEKPVNVKATAGDGKVDLSWDDADGAYGYKVYVFNEKGDELFDTQLTKNTSITIEKLTNNTTYAFIVRSVSVDEVLSDYTTEDVVYATPVAPAKPEKPTILGVKPGENKVKLEWKAVNGAEMYRVYTYENGVYTRRFTCDGSRTIATVTELEAGKKYGFVVSAKANGVWTDYSDKADLIYATPTAPVEPVVVKPAITAYKPGNYKVKLEWKAVEGAEMYRVYTYENGAYTRKFTCLGSRNVATVTSLVSGVKLGFVVSAKVNGTWTDYTDKADLVYATPVGDPAPVITGVKGGDGKVKISWYALSGAEMYRVYTCENGAYTRKFTCNGSTNVATVTGLTNGKEYAFVVSAKVNGVWTNYKVSELLVYATPNA